MKKACIGLVMVLFLGVVSGCDEEDKKASEQKIQNLQRDLDLAKSENVALQGKIEANSTVIRSLERQVVSVHESKYSLAVIVSVVSLVVGIALAARTGRKHMQQRRGDAGVENTERSSAVH